MHKLYCAQSQSAVFAAIIFVLACCLNSCAIARLLSIFKRQAVAERISKKQRIVTARSIFVFLLCLYAIIPTNSSMAFAQRKTVARTKAQINELDKTIKTLQQTLDKAENKQVLLRQELAVTEKEMGSIVHQMRLIRANVQETSVTVENTEQNILKLNRQLNKQQDLLAKHLIARYKMGSYQPVKWLLTMQCMSCLSQQLTYYQYLLRARTQAIQKVKATKGKLKKLKEHLEIIVNQKKALISKLTKEQQKYQQKKQYQQTILTKLDAEISSQRQAIEMHQKNMKNLAGLLENLANHSRTRMRTPFSKMKHKLSHPIDKSHATYKVINRGLLFLASEGENVQAIYPGKVVFSDWLRGYGLLMILDHGQGFMSLYAHNQSLFKATGEHVNQGETIATVGHTGGVRQNGLYFEIRKRGKVISSLDWLS